MNKNLIGFFDIIKDEKIKSYDITANENDSYCFGLINNYLFIFAEFYRFYPITLKNH